MEMNKIIFLVIIAAMVLFAVLRAKKLRNTRCEKCSGAMKFDQLYDPAGANKTKKITYSFYQGQRNYSEKWKCKDCAHTQIVKYWGS